MQEIASLWGKEWDRCIVRVDSMNGTNLNHEVEYSNDQ